MLHPSTCARIHSYWNAWNGLSCLHELNAEHQFLKIWYLEDATPLWHSFQVYFKNFFSVFKKCHFMDIWLSVVRLRTFFKPEMKKLLCLYSFNRSHKGKTTSIKKSRFHCRYKNVRQHKFSESAYSNLRK